MTIQLWFKKLILLNIVILNLNACLTDITIPQAPLCDETQTCPQRFMCLEGRCTLVQFVEREKDATPYTSPIVDRGVVPQIEASVEHINNSEPLHDLIDMLDISPVLDQGIIDMMVEREILIKDMLLMTSPNHNTVNNTIDTKVVLYFSDHVQALVGDIIIRDLTDGSDHRTIPILNEQISITGSIVTITLNSLLEMGTRYEVTMAEGVLSDINGHHVSQLIPGQFNFTTLPITSLKSIQGIATGRYLMTADEQQFEGYVYNDSNHSWLLIGKGREGWEFDTDGQGTLEGVITNLGTVAGFSPNAYADVIINELLSNAFVNLTEVQILIKRAANSTGSLYQNVLWEPILQENWTWAFDTLPYTIIQKVQVSILGNEHERTLNTRDANAGNDHRRLFTWDWNAHNYQKGFSYGARIQGVNDNDTHTFLWEYRNEQHAIPYTEVYIRIKDD